MRSTIAIAGLGAGGLHSSLLAGGPGVPPTPAISGVAFATLASWLIAESLGAWMLRSTVATGGLKRRGRASGMPVPVIFGHAGLAFTGFLSWISFLATGIVALAWLAVGLLAPAIGLGLSAVILWTPYPVHRAAPEPAPPDVVPAGLITDEVIARALADEALTSRLVDDLLARMLNAPAPAKPRRSWDLAPLIPAAHGVFALATFLLATVTAATT